MHIPNENDRDQQYLKMYSEMREKGNNQGQRLFGDVNNLKRNHPMII